MKLYTSNNHYTTAPSMLDNYAIHVRQGFIPLNELLIKMIRNKLSGDSALLITWEIPLYAAVGVLTSLNIFLTLIIDHVLKQGPKSFIVEKFKTNFPLRFCSWFLIGDDTFEQQSRLPEFSLSV